MISRLKANAGRLTAGVISALLLAMAWLPHLQATPTTELAGRFAFKGHEIEPVGALNGRLGRDVHPDYRHIASWISSVGASVAVGDLDQDGIANDICLVDPRNDSVTIRPALAGAASRYQPFGLVAGRVPDGPPIAPTGCIIADVDADGRQDVIVYYWGRAPLVFRSSGRLEAAGFTGREIAPGEIWYSNAGLFADIDGDGFGDLMIGNYFPDGSGVLDAEGRLPVEMQHSMSRADNAGMNRLFLSRNAGTPAMHFEDVSAHLSPEMANGWTLALGGADLTGDGLPEIYVANDFGPDRMLLNTSTAERMSFELAEGRRGLADIGSGVMGRDSFKGMGVDFGDVDGDGHFDIYVSNIAERYALLESHFLFQRDPGADWSNGKAPYRNVSGPLGLARSGWAWDAKLADFDNDGGLEAVQATGFVRGTTDRWPELQELAMGNDELLWKPGVWPRVGAGDDLSGHDQDPFYVMGPDGAYHDVATQVGLETTAVSRGIALADMDGDGDLDFAVARQWDASVIYENVQVQRNASMVLDLRLTNPNGTTRPAIGAIARVVLADGRVVTGLADTSNGHSGHRAPEIHLGLGPEAGRAYRVEVTWRARGRLERREIELEPGRHSIVLDRVVTAGN